MGPRTRKSLSPSITTTLPGSTLVFHPFASELASKLLFTIYLPQDHALTHNPSVFNNYYENVHLGIDTRDGAQLLVENNVFANSPKPIYSTDGGYAVANGNDFGGAKPDVPNGTYTSVPYSYSLDDTSSVKSDVLHGAGAKLSF